ncbi:MAG: 4Fe-4S dicluster domain-containing protein [bacterium]|nr:4Fe-4S dicluster domain-containing protein [bacterium]
MINKNDGKYNRRDFLSKSAKGLTAAGVLGITGTATEASNEKASQKPSNKKLITRKLGKTGLELPVVSMGVMNAHNPELVKHSYEMGIRHFDTAQYYQRGRNEEMLGNVLHELKVRDKVILATKILLRGKKYSPKEAKEAFLSLFEESLKRLKTTYIDIMYLHNVDKIEQMNNPGVQEAMTILKKQKKIRFTGITTHANMADILNEAARTGFYEVILTAINYSMSTNTKLLSAMKNAAAKGIGLIAMKTQCQQPWFRDSYEPASAKEFYKGNLMHSALLKWAMHLDYIATSVPGYTTFEQLETDFALNYDLNYTAEEKKFLTDKKVKLALQSVCQQCSGCIASCPQKADIPDLLRTHMYAASYANFYHARNTLNDIPKEKGLQACESCGECTATCVNKVNIAERIHELKAIYS